MAPQRIGTGRKESLGRVVRVLVLIGMFGATLTDRGLAQAPNSAQIQIEQLTGVGKKDLTGTAPDGTPAPNSNGMVLLSESRLPVWTPSALPISSNQESVLPVTVIPQTSIQPVAADVNLAPPVQMDAITADYSMPVANNLELPFPVRNTGFSSPVMDGTSTSHSDVLESRVTTAQATGIAESQANIPDNKTTNVTPVPAAMAAEKAQYIPAIPALPQGTALFPTEQQASEEHVAGTASDIELWPLILGLTGIAIIAVFFYCIGGPQSRKKPSVCQKDQKCDTAAVADAAANSRRVAEAAGASPSSVGSNMPRLTQPPTLVSAGACLHAVQFGPEFYNVEERRYKAQKERVHEAVWQTIFDDDHGFWSENEVPLLR